MNNSFLSFKEPGEGGWVCSGSEDEEETPSEREILERKRKFFGIKPNEVIFAPDSDDDDNIPAKPLPIIIEETSSEGETIPNKQVKRRKFSKKKNSTRETGEFLDSFFTYNVNNQFYLKYKKFYFFDVIKKILFF